MRAFALANGKLDHVVHGIVEPFGRWACEMPPLTHRRGECFGQEAPIELVREWVFSGQGARNTVGGHCSGLSASAIENFSC
jgi:hypothetical protein